MTVRENVQTALHAYRRRPGEADAILERVGMADQAEQRRAPRFAYGDLKRRRARDGARAAARACC